MTRTKSNVVNLSDEIFKRTGARPKKVKKKAPKKTTEDSNSSLVVGLALNLLAVVKPYKKRNPLAVAAALLLAGKTLVEEYKEMIGTDKTKELVTMAESISERFKPEYRDAQSDGTVATTQEDEPQR